MRTIKPFFRILKYIFVASVLLLLMADDCNYTLKTSADPPAGGIVLRDDRPDAGTLDEWDVLHENPIRLEAVPNPGFVFSHWEHNGSDDATRTAVFIADPDNIVSAGPPPTVTINSPVEGTHFGLADAITFSGGATDVEDGSLTEGFLIWSSNLDGQIGTGVTFDRPLTSGAHTITLTATNSVAISGTASVIVSVGNVTNRMPEVTIDSPAPASMFLTTDDIAFSGSADDPEDGALTGASLVWTSSLDGPIGTGGSFNATLREGSHDITLTAGWQRGPIPS